MKEYFVWLAKLVTFLLVLLVFVPLLFGAIVAATKLDSLQMMEDDGKKKVAVLELTGIIQSSKDILKNLHKHLADDTVAGVVLRVDTPGGAVGPSQEIFSAVKALKAKKPIVASMGTVAASGGLYAALGASKVFCQPGTLTGSIGVILQVPNVSKIVSKYGFDMVTIKSGELKDAGNMFRAMTEKDRQFLQATVAEAHEAFVQAVIDGRGLERKAVEKFSDGRLILGSQAKELGLVDDFGDVYAAARVVYELAGEPLKEDEMPELLYSVGKFAELKKLLDTVVSLPSIFESHTKLQYLMG
ncbi:signal peptide peptidase SppA [Oligoflexia bacterium]|nr:signal peptide peptidase SppA [Oligoflexia bacterium]